MWGKGHHRNGLNHKTNRRYGMRRIGAIALVLSTGLVCAMSAQAKPKHQPLKCKAGYTRGTVRIAKRVHGRIVRRHGRIVYIKVQRCVKTPKPKPSSPGPAAPGTPTTPTTAQPAGTMTTPSRPRTPSPAPPPDLCRRGGGGYRAAAGCNPCEQSATASLTQTFSPASVFVLGDNQYDSGWTASTRGRRVRPTWGQAHSTRSCTPFPGTTST